MAGGHNVRVTSWITVLLLVAASIVFGFALPTRSIVLTVIGGVLLLAGVVLGFVYRVMDDAY